MRQQRSGRRRLHQVDMDANDAQFQIFPKKREGFANLYEDRNAFSVYFRPQRYTQ